MRGKSVAASERELKLGKKKLVEKKVREKYEKWAISKTMVKYDVSNKLLRLMQEHCGVAITNSEKAKYASADCFH